MAELDVEALKQRLGLIIAEWIEEPFSQNENDAQILTDRLVSVIGEWQRDALEGRDRPWPNFKEQLRKGTEEVRAERDAALEDRERLRAALEDLAWNEKDGRCWCMESPERNDMRHSQACLNAKSALEGRDG